MGTVFGGGAPEPAVETAWLWPECVDLWGHWCAVQTQWRSSGMGGRDGLCYAGVRAYLDENDLQGPERRETFVCIQAAEHASLEVWAEQAKERARAQQQQR